MFVRGFDLISAGNDRPDRVASQRTARPAFKPFAGAGIAVLLLTFIAGEALTTVHAFRYESPVAATVPRSPATMSKPATIPTTVSEKRNAHGNLDRAGQAIAFVIRDRSESRAGDKVKGPVTSASRVLPPAK